MSTDQQYASSPGPGQGILALTEHGWPVDERSRPREATSVLEGLEAAAQALYRAHQVLAPRVRAGVEPGPVSQVWAFGLELALNQAVNLVPAQRHQAIFDPVDAASGLVDVERLVLEAEQALRTFQLWDGPAGTADLVRMVLDLLVDLRADSRGRSR